MNRVNMGCGITPIKDWINYDNYKRFLFPTNKLFVGFIDKIGLLDEVQKDYIEAKIKGKIKRVNILGKIPLKNNSMQVVYSSHVIEHLDRTEVSKFLSESFRILEHRGIFRLVTPDLEKLAKAYIKHGNGNEFIGGLGLARIKRTSLREKIKYFINGFTYHRWIYDERSLKELLEKTGFINPIVLPPGKTTISNPGDLNLFEKAEGDLSIFIEASKP